MMRHAQHYILLKHSYKIFLAENGKRKTENFYFPLNPFPIIQFSVLRFQFSVFKVLHCVCKDILAFLACDILEQAVIVTLRVSHLAENLSVLRDDSLDTV